MKAPFEINLRTGSLNFPVLEMTLTSRQSLHAFLVTDAGRNAVDGGGNGGWQRYHFHRRPLPDGRVLGVSLFFFEGCLAQVTFGYRPESESSWSNWSEKQERARAEIYQRDLAQQLGRTGQFPWGKAGAGYDDKAAAAILWVNYTSQAK